jgi:mRNA interferase RelE/StbE
MSEVIDMRGPIRMRTLDALRQVESYLCSEPLPKAKENWGGADVVITSKAPKVNSESGGFYPDPRFVISRHASELSWLFEALRDAFYAENRLDSQTKVEFFGQLANAANRCLAQNADSSARELCAAVLHESFAIYEEMDEGAFESLSIAIGNEIVDDYVDEALRSGFIEIKDTRKFFLERGVDLETLDITYRVQGFLTGLQAKQSKQVTDKILSLMRDPFPQDCKHLSGHPGMRRVDVGEYRICYSVKDFCIEIVVVGPRNDDAAYKQLHRVRA